MNSKENMLFDVQERQKPTELCIMHGGLVTYILEAAVKDLKLLAGETGLGFELFQALWAMTDGR